MPIYDMIYLGKFDDIDPDERTTHAERAASQFARSSFGSSKAPLYAQRVQVDMQDRDDDGLILTNNWSGAQEHISYSLAGKASSSNEIDAAFTAQKVEVIRLLPDGSTDRVTTTVRVIQDTEGHTFVMPPPLTDSTESEVEAMTSLPILSIRFPAAKNFTTGYTAAYAGRHGTSNFVACFTKGTAIMTDCGERPVEAILPGELVMTKDNGLQPVRWRATRQIDVAELRSQPNLRPIMIAPDALGPGRPDRPLLVSPQHRVLVRSAIAQRMFGAQELLVPACQLTENPGIDVTRGDCAVTYVHLLFDRHEILLSNGAETESLFPGPQALKSMGEAAEELFALFPQLRDLDLTFPAARRVVAGHKARQLVRRHIANHKPLAGSGD